MDDTTPKSQRMLSEAKDTSELMVDLGYAALFFADDAHGRRGDGARGAPQRARPRDARGVRARGPVASATPSRSSSVLHVVSAIERMGNAAVDISRVVTHRLGIPPRSSPTSARPKRCRTACASATDRASRAAASTRSTCRWTSACASSRSGAAASGSFDPDGEDLHARRRRADRAGRTRRHRRAARARGRAGVACRPRSRRTRRSATSTAPSTCWSR